MSGYFRDKFFSGDQHFGHAAMLNPNSVGRPFSSVEEMNEALIENHNAIVKPNDIVIYLGDFALRAPDDEVARIFHRLNGEKHLIIGNHDVDKRGNLLPALARLPWAKPPVHLSEINHGGTRIVLSHYAMMTWNARHHGAYQAFGHSHGRMVGLPGTLDVGVDAQNYRPISVEDFILQAENTLIDAPRIIDEHLNSLSHELYRDGGWAERGRQIEEEREAKARLSQRRTL